MELALTEDSNSNVQNCHLSEVAEDGCSYEGCQSDVKNISKIISRGSLSQREVARMADNDSDLKLDPLNPPK